VTHNAAAPPRSVVEVPVMAVGRIHDPRLAERILRGGQADLIAMGRPLLADPSSRTSRAPAAS
jgi:2,4-dienoyl-CoA reductase (NADPH2)